MIIEFYTVNIFVQETFINSVGPSRVGLGWSIMRSGRAGLSNTWPGSSKNGPISRPASAAVYDCSTDNEVNDLKTERLQTL